MRLGTLDLLRVHERSLIKLSNFPATKGTMARRGETFFAAMLGPMEELHRTAHVASVRFASLSQTLQQRNMDLAAARQRLKEEIEQREKAEKLLLENKLHYDRLLAQSGQMQEKLRLLSRQLLLAQEDERKKISRELHDVIAQTLTSINVRLAGLRKEATLNNKGIERSIARTQRLIQHSVSIVHRFARELRPTVLDDLGLIPALHTFLKSFQAETGIRVSLSAFAAIEKVNGDKRTALYRVAQEALTNVARHSQATRADVKIQQLAGAVCMGISDNGKGFQEQLVSHSKEKSRLGLLGMRERLEMVGGSFTIQTAPGKGTTILAQIPLPNGPTVKGGGTENLVIDL
jgi:signal transduction histidine kinase